MKQTPLRLCLNGLLALTLVEGGFALAQTAMPAEPSSSPSVFRDKLSDGTEGPAMVVIPAGEFLMGSPASEAKRDSNEGPPHPVKLKSFALGQTEVTQMQWRQVMGGDPPELYFNGCDDCPVENVSWNDIQGFLKKLNSKTGKRYRLPSESEWEYAARAGTRTPFSTGNTITPEQANFDGVYTYNGSSKGRYREQTIAVGSFKPNDFGLYDMHGNVWEWVEDCWHDDYNGAPGDGSAWTSNCAENRRVLRGGSWNDNPRYLRSAFRYGEAPVYRGDYGGFRVARTLP